MRLAILVGLLTLVTSIGVRAGETEDAVGRMHFDAGDRFYSDGNYAAALKEFTAGYEHTRRPAFLLNIAQSLRKLGNPEKAREYYKTFLHRDSRSPLVPEVNRVIEEIDHELTPQPASSPQPQKKKRVVTWIGLGLTAASLVAAVGLAGATKVEFDNLSATCAPNCSDAKIDRFERINSDSIGMFVTETAWKPSLRF